MGCNKSRFHVDIMDIHDKVTGSCHLCTITFPRREKLKFLVDCGLFQGEEPQEYNKDFPFNPMEVSFCMVTHNHVDHTGRLPLLVRKGFCGNIYATETTCDFLPKALEDSLSVMTRNSKKGGDSPIYGEEDVGRALQLRVQCSYNETIQVHEHVKVDFLENNHVPGAAMILIRISFPGYEDINLLFTGDYNDKNVFLEDAVIPEWVFDLPITIIQEATYGDTDSDEIEPCFDRNILKAVEEDWTSLVLAPSFTRAQEILYRLKCMQNIGLLDTQIPIYLDGKLSISYTSMFLKGFARMREGMLDFLPENCTFVDKPIRNSLLHDDNSCKIIVTSSGMGSYGPARSYIPAYLGRNKMLIHFTCYVAEGTLGRKIKDVPNGESVKVAGLDVVKKAKVEYTSESSSHARANIIIGFLKRFTKLKLVLLNHAETPTKETFKERIRNEVENCKHVDTLDRATAYRVNAWGLQKKHPSNFPFYSKECPWGEVKTDPTKFI